MTSIEEHEAACAPAFAANDQDAVASSLEAIYADAGWSRAERYLRGLLERTGSDLVRLVWVSKLGQLRRFDEFLKLARAVLSSPTPSLGDAGFAAYGRLFELYVTTCCDLAWKGEPKSAEAESAADIMREMRDTVAGAEAVLEPHVWTEFGRGLERYVAGDHMGAIRAFGRLRDCFTSASAYERLWLHNSLGAPHIHANALSLARDNLSTDDSGFSPPAPIDFSEVFNSAGSHADLIGWTTCDLSYFRRHFETFLLSCLDSRVDIHVHIFLSAANEAAEVREISARATLNAGANMRGGARVTVQVAPEVAGSPPYLASARYIYAPDALELHRCPILVTDVDAVVFLPGDRLNEIMKCNDAAAWIHFDQPMPIRSPYPWRSVSAGRTILCDTAGARRLARAISQVLSAEMAMATAYHTWWVDQAALYVCFLAAQEQPNLSIFDLRATDLDVIRIHEAGEERADFQTRIRDELLGSS